MTRSPYGFPILPAKLEAAQQYAAAALLRNTTPCQCVTCRNIEMLPGVQRLVKNWSKR